MNKIYHEMYKMSINELSKADKLTCIKNVFADVQKYINTGNKDKLSLLRDDIETLLLILNAEDMNREDIELVDINVMDWLNISDKEWRALSIHKYPSLDHVKMIRIKDKIILLSEPYDLQQKDLIEILSFCEQFNLEVHIGSNSYKHIRSIHAPNRTAVVWFTKKE